MRYFILYLLIFSSFQGISQIGIWRINSYWPQSPNVGDTVNIEYDYDFPLFEPNGKTCGVLLGYSDTLINSKVQYMGYFDMCFTTMPVTFCFRTDTAQYVYNNANVDTIMFIWNWQGTICAPVPNRNTDTAYIYFNTVG